MFEILFVIIFAAYCLQAFILSIGSKSKFPKIKEGDVPTASVVVAARNEEDKIVNCLISLDKLIYPDGKLEIIIVDDDSTDDTYSIVESFIKNKPNFKLIKPTKDFGETRGKARAIANAVEIANGEIILTTDADCQVTPKWAKTITSYYQDDVVMVCGYTNQRSNTIFESVQDMDFIYLLTVAGGAINLGKPLSAIGNNMSYRKSAYLEVGGYENIPFSVTEDFELLMALDKLKGKRIIYPADPEGLVTSEPCKNLKTFFMQKRRWAIGGLNSRIDNLLIISTGFWAAIFTILMIFFYSVDLFYLFLFKVFIDLFMIYFMYKRLKLKFNFGNYFMYEIFQISYFTIVGISIIFSKKVVWKGRKY